MFKVFYPKVLTQILLELQQVAAQYLPTRKAVLINDLFALYYFEDNSVLLRPV